MFLETLIQVLEFIVGALTIKDLIIKLLVVTLMNMMPARRKIVQYIEEQHTYSREH